MIGCSDEEPGDALSRIPPAFEPFAAIPRWCAWVKETRTTKAGEAGTQKTPYIGWFYDSRKQRHVKLRGKVNASATWLTGDRALDLASAFADQGAQGGIGVLLGRLDNGTNQSLVCIDLDAARSPDTGGLEPWAAAVVARFADSFAEVSPSGRGVHLFLLVHDDDLQAFRREMPLGKAGRKWARPAVSGQKAEAIEILIGGYSTVTGHALVRAPQRISRARLEDLRWLVCEAGPALQSEPSRDPVEVEPRNTVRQGAPAAKKAPDSEARERTVRGSKSQLRRMVTDRDLNDSEFQMLAAFWWQARQQTRPKFRRSSVAHAVLESLPGARQQSHRASNTVTATKRSLDEKGLLHCIQKAERPWAARQGKAKVYEVIALLPYDPRRGAPGNDVLRAEVFRIAETVWERMVFGLPPFELRVLLWLLSTQKEEAFWLAARAVAEVLGRNPERAGEALDSLCGEGWLECIVPRMSGRPGCYRLSEELRRHGEEHPPTPNNLVVAAF